MDPDADPAFLVIDLQDVNKKLIKKSQNRRNQGFSYYFCLMIGSGSTPLTSGSGSGRPKNMWSRIRNTAKNMRKVKE
jgi:hypothetical protein